MDECHEICADPDLIRVVDGHGADMKKATEVETARGWKRISDCPLRKYLNCKWDVVK